MRAKANPKGPFSINEPRDLEMESSRGLRGEWFGAAFPPQVWEAWVAFLSSLRMGEACV